MVTMCGYVVFEVIGETFYMRECVLEAKCFLMFEFGYFGKIGGIMAFIGQDLSFMVDFDVVKPTKMIIPRKLGHFEVTKTSGYFFQWCQRITRLLFSKRRGILRKGRYHGMVMRYIWFFVMVMTK